MPIRSLLQLLHRPAHRHPVRLRLRRSRLTIHSRDAQRGPVTVYLPGWDWTVLGEQGETLDAGWAPTWDRAHAQGAAAADVARASW